MWKSEGVARRFKTAYTYVYRKWIDGHKHGKRDFKVYCFPF